MNQILDRLFLGSLADGQAATAPITCLLNVSQYSYDSPLRTIWAPLEDEVLLPPEEWQSLVHVLAVQLSHGETVLVHCRLGKSRAPALVAAYLVSCGWTPGGARNCVQARRREVAIHEATWAGIDQWWMERGKP
jgi:protein-tyrosine phosphatase